MADQGATLPEVCGARASLRLPVCWNWTPKIRWMGARESNIPLRHQPPLSGYRALNIRVFRQNNIQQKVIERW